MGKYLEEVIYFLKHEDVFDFIYTYLTEHIELLVVVIAIIFIMVLSLWTMLERMQEKGWAALMPVYRFVVLFEAVGLKSWLAVLMLVPGVNFIMRIVFYVYVARKFSRTYWLLPGLILIPLVFLPIVAFGDGQCPHVRVERPRRERKVRQRAGAAKARTQAGLLNRKASRKPRLRLKPAREANAQSGALSMAELKAQRSEAKSSNRGRVSQGVARAGREAARPVTPKSDRMPEMRRGAISRDIEQQKKKAEVMQMSEYERLLLKQQKAQKKRLAQSGQREAQKKEQTQTVQRQGRKRQTIDMVRRAPKRKPSVRPSAKPPVKAPVKPSDTEVKVHFD